MKEDESAKIQITNMIINGEELYDTFYSKINEKIEYKIVTELTESQDIIIYKQLQELFKKIDFEVNKNVFATEVKEDE